jgi:hypothetical protein
LVDTFVQFLDATFAGPGNVLLAKVRNSTLTDQDRKEVQEVHTSALAALTRLRVLASKELAKAAEKLHLADDYGYAVVSRKVELPDDDTWELHRTRVAETTACDVGCRTGRASPR